MILLQHPFNLWCLKTKYGHQNPSKSPSDHLSHPWALRAAHHSSAWPSALWTWRQASTAQPHWASGTWGPRWQAHTFTLFIYSRSRNALGCQIDEFSIVLCHPNLYHSVSASLALKWAKMKKCLALKVSSGVQDRDSRCHSSHLRQLTSLTLVLVYHRLSSFIIVYHRLSSWSHVV